MAFVHAISSAGVAHALTKACSAGELANCGCDRSLKGTTPEGFEVSESDRGFLQWKSASRSGKPYYLHSTSCRLLLLQWSGCSDNVDFGITFSRAFVDARDRRKSRKKPRNAQPLMNLHNNEAGRKVREAASKSLQLHLENVSRARILTN